METKRKALYSEILNSVKNSPIRTVEFEGNTYHFKLEYKLPYGESHYSRIFAKLIYIKECLGIIKQGDVLLETTSGSGGRAAAKIATALGYPIKIALPAGGEKKREDAIIMAGGSLFLTPAETYVDGFPEFVSCFLKQNPETKFLSHMMGDIYGRGTIINEVALSAFHQFVDEVAEEGICPDFVISPLGNGTTTLPLINGFKGLNRKTKIIGFEAASSAYSFRQKYPGRYEEDFGIDPSCLPRHNLPGTTPSKSTIPAPALKVAINLLDQIVLVSNPYIDDCFLKATGFLPKGEVIRCSEGTFPFMDEFGRTGKAGFFVALDYSRKTKCEGKQFLIPVFDAAWHYDK